ncbi:MAG: type II secretion system F family protein [Oceanidesulfovibrio sp.]
MPRFQCAILDASGRESSEVLSAATSADAAAMVKKSGRFLLGVKAMDDAKSGRGAQTEASQVNLLLNPARRKDLVLLFRQLAVLLEAGLGIIQALSILGRQTKRLGTRMMLQSVRLAVESGVSLSEAMSRHRVFTPYIINIIKAAEISGEMELALNNIADRLEASAVFKRQIITSMIYPAIVILTASVVVAYLTLNVIPKFKALLGEGRALPPITQMVMDVSSWMQANWLYLFGSIIGVIVLTILLRKTEEGSRVIDTVLLRVPIVGGVLRCNIVVNFSNNMAVLFSSGVPLMDALETVRGTLGNKAAMLVVDEIMEDVLEGQALSGPLLRNPRIFPNMVGEMVSTGEETGELVRVLELAADIYHKMLEANIKRMNSLIEPLLLLVLGSIVGLVFYALISGMLAVYGL